MVHGIKVTEISTGARAIAAISTAVIGLIATATDAQAGVFPLDTPVRIDDVSGAIADAGVNGTLAKALTAIADQCSPTVVVVRFAEGANADATETAAIAALNKLVAAESVAGAKPRIIGAPGYDTQDVANALVTVAQKLRGFAYAKAQGADAEDAADYRENFSARELMMLWPEWSDWDGSAVARALGTRARIDSETGWHKTLSNVGVNGVKGVDTPVDFDALGGASTAALLNDADVTTLVRMNGFRYWGNRTCSDEPLFAFESTVRTAQVLQDEIANGLIWAIDKPITGSLIKDIVATINGRFAQLASQGRIVGARCWFDANANPASALAGGTVTIDYEFTACAPAEAIMLNQRITDKFYASIADQLG